MNRLTVDVAGTQASYLAAGESGRVVLMLHGTYWSRVWQPVMNELAHAGFRAIAVDFPGLGRSAGELTVEQASIPALAEWVVEFLHALRIDEPIFLAGHDIGGGVAQHVLIEGRVRVEKLVLMNAVMFDSWPAPGVARFRDSAVAAVTTHQEILAARRVSVMTALGRPADEDEISEYLDPWQDERVARSWLALAGAADSRYTMALAPQLRVSQTPKLLIWGEEDTFQPVQNAEKFVSQIAQSRLVRIPRAGHIPTENDAAAVARAMIDFLA